MTTRYVFYTTGCQEFADFIMENYWETVTQIDDAGQVYHAELTQDQKNDVIVHGIHSGIAWGDCVSIGSGTGLCHGTSEAEGVCYCDDCYPATQAPTSPANDSIEEITPRKSEQGQAMLALAVPAAMLAYYVYSLGMTPIDALALLGG